MNGKLSMRRINGTLGAMRAGPATLAKRASGGGRAAFGVRAQASNTEDDTMGFKTMRKGVKEASDETLLTPRFYTTDFDEMAALLEEFNPNINMDEFDACLNEFRNDYNRVLCEERYVQEGCGED